jgi:hypothetical protein
MRPLNVPALALNIGPAVNVLGFIDRHGALSRNKSTPRGCRSISDSLFKTTIPTETKKYALSS